VLERPRGRAPGGGVLGGREKKDGFWTKDFDLI
jgi:hypothetical protein